MNKDEIKPWCYGGNVTIMELVRLCRCDICPHFNDCNKILTGETMP